MGIAGNSSQAVQASWIAALPDTHRIRVTVSPFNLPVEASYSNNAVTKTVLLGQPIVGVNLEQQYKLWLGSPQPNPSNGTVLFRFSLPSPSKVTFGHLRRAGAAHGKLGQ